MRRVTSVFLIFSVLACGPEAGDWQTSADGVITDPAERQAVLDLVNDPAIGFSQLDDDVRLDRRAARRIIEYRNGDDGVVGTSDDTLFSSIAELDEVPYVGATALGRLLDYAKANGYLQSNGQVSEAERAAAILAVANDPEIDFTKLDVEIGLDRRAATNIIARRPFARLDALDAVPYVGDKALDRLFEYAVLNGYVGRPSSRQAAVIFSPQAYDDSHAVRVAEVIGTARNSLDIAMYSFSDALISDAIDAAVRRGVKVRFLFDTASEDRKLAASERGNSKSGRLENMGVDVRWVNKIMHHKMMIVDGPRDDAGAAATATLVTGSGNWSRGAATRYDENTLFLTGFAELALELQREFNLLWQHSRDFEHVALPFELSTYEIDVIEDDPTTAAVFTSANFRPSGDTFRIVSGRDSVSDVLVAAIAGATQSIWVASGHLRSRPVAEALLAKHAASPNVDIRVYLDGQEYISDWYHGEQQRSLTDCLANANGSASRTRQCNDKGFYFGYELGLAGIDVRYKYYAYRWDYSYADQMHHKYLIIDGDELWTGSYNLSDNAEHNTFENMLQFRDGPALVGAYASNFAEIWDTERDTGRYASLVDRIETDDEFPIVFDPMALTWGEVSALKSVIRDNCADINSQPFRTEAEQHRWCTR